MSRRKRNGNRQTALLPDPDPSTVPHSAPSAETPISPSDPVPIDASIALAKLKIVFDFQYQSIVYTVDLLSKYVTYYFTVIAILTGILIGRDTKLETRMFVAVTTSAVSGLLAVIIVAIGYGVLRGAREMRQTLEHIDADNFAKLRMDCYFRRGICVAIVVCLACLMILATIATALVLSSG